MNQEEQLLQEAMVPLGEILDPLDVLIRGEKGSLIILPLFFVSFGGLAFFESKENPVYFLILGTGLAVCFFCGLKRYRRLKVLYRKIEDWPYTSKEALVEAHSAITSHLTGLESWKWTYGLVPLIAVSYLFIPKARDLLKGIFMLENPMRNLLQTAFFIALAILLFYLFKKNYQKSLNRDYREPLIRLQQIIDRF